MFTWFLKVKQLIMPLTALERFIAENHKDNHGSAYLTYLYFLAYEDAVIARIKQIETFKNEQVYTETLGLLRGEQSKTAIENTHYKTFLYNFSVFLVIALVLAASAVSTTTLMDLIDGRFGAYTYFAQSMFYICATWSQWMIFRKHVPQVLASFFYIGRNKDGWNWHYLKKRELFVNESGALDLKIDPKGSPSLSPSQQWVLFAFTVCTAILALSLGMIVLEKGPVFQSMHYPSFLVTDSVLWFLCIVYIFCHFALYISSVINLLKDENGIKTIYNNIKRDMGIALFVMLTMSMFGLINTMTAQSKSTFMFFNLNPFDENFMVIVGDDIIASIALFSVLAASGRVIFNLKAMHNLYLLFKYVAPQLPSILWKDIKDNTINYAVGSALTIGVVIALTLIGLNGDASTVVRDTHHFVPTELFGTAIGLTIVGALLTWGIFKATKNYMIGIQPQNLELRTELHLKETSELRSGQMFGAVLVNGATSGAISVSGMEIIIALYGHALTGTQHEYAWHIGLLALAGFAGGFVAMASTMNSVELDAQFVEAQSVKEQLRFSQANTPMQKTPKQSPALAVGT